MVDQERRTALAVTCVAGGAGTAALLWPFLASLAPSERAKALGAPVNADISNLKPGEMMTVEWRGQPVWIVRRTPEMLASLARIEARLADPNSERSIQPDYVTGDARAIKPEYLVVIGICTHLGCTPTPFLQPGDPAMGPAWPGGFLCPCHGSRFDLSARVFANMPAPTNLSVPSHKYLSETLVRVGEDTA